MQADIPGRAQHQAVGVVVLQRAAAHGHFIAGRSGVLAHQRITVRHIHEHGQITGAGLVAAGQPGGLHVTGSRHAQQARLGIHLLDEGIQATWEGATQRMGSTVFAGHQGQVQHFGTGERGAHGQARTAALFGIHIILRDGDGFIHGQMGLGNQQTRHQLGQRGDGQHGMVVLAEQHFVGVLVHDQGHAALEIKRIGHCMQPGHLPERQAWLVGNGTNGAGSAAGGHAAGLARALGNALALGSRRGALLHGLLLDRGHGHLFLGNFLGRCGMRARGSESTTQGQQRENLSKSTEAGTA